MKLNLLLVFFSLISWSVQAQSAFWLRNTDPSAVFYYWTMEGSSALPQGEVLPILPVAPGGRHPVAPGERVKIMVPQNKMLVGAFVPWSENLSFRSIVKGGFLLATETPARGTLLVDRSSFAAANRGRTLEAALQQWGLPVPQFVLDGRGADWGKIRPAVEWGAGFLPGNQPWPSSSPRVRTLQVADREGALWLLLSSDLPWTSLPRSAAVSLVLRRPGAFLEWPLTGSDGTVWSWVDGAEALSVGWRILNGNILEAWVPWDRMTESEHKSWMSAQATWSLMVTENDTPKVYDLASTSLGEWP